MQVTLRPLREEDAYTSVNWRNDKEVFRYTGNTYSDIITLESELSWIKRVINNPDEIRMAIECEGEYVGNIYITDIEDREGEYHIFIGNKDFWGKGVAFDASRLLLDYSFRTLGLRRIKLKVKIQNKAAIRLYQKLGFIEESRDDLWINMYIDETSFQKQLKSAALS